AISLYWVTGGLFMIAQSYLLGKLYKQPAAASSGTVEVAASAGKG
ncbi:MAG: hypothetical protein K0Q63_2480, partial [Paenibacillus sp.]|nr:hypothetical protein [Paenibacillus sp.]